MRLLSRLRRSFIAARPDVFVGIDAPDTNLRLARRLHRGRHSDRAVRQPAGMGLAAGPRAHIHESVDLVLCLLPFEKRFYDGQGVPAEFVGHPLADAIPIAVDRAAARAALDLPPRREIVALLPGSRRGEVTRLAGGFRARPRPGSRAQRPGLRFVAPMASAGGAGDFFAGARARRARRLQ